MDSLFLKDGKSTDPLEVSSSPCGFPDCSVGKASACNAGLLDSWVRKICCRRERLPTPVSWPGEFHGLYNPWGLQESDTTKQLSLSLYSPGNPLPLTSPTSQQWGATACSCQKQNKAKQTNNKKNQ